MCLIHILWLIYICRKSVRHAVWVAGNYFVFCARDASGYDPLFFFVLSVMDGLFIGSLIGSVEDILVFSALLWFWFTPEFSTPAGFNPFPPPVGMDWYSRCSYHFFSSRHHLCYFHRSLHQSHWLLPFTWSLLNYVTPHGFLLQSLLWVLGQHCFWGKYNCPCPWHCLHHLWHNFQSWNHMKSHICYCQRM